MWSVIWRNFTDRKHSMGKLRNSQIQIWPKNHSPTSSYFDYSLEIQNPQIWGKQIAPPPLHPLPSSRSMREACMSHTYRGVMSNIRMTTNVGMNHVAHMTESCPAYEYVTYRHEPRHTNEWVASHMNKVTHVKASCHACRRVTFLRNMCISISMWLSVDALDAPL